MSHPSAIITFVFLLFIIPVPGPGALPTLVVSALSQLNCAFKLARKSTLFLVSVGAVSAAGVALQDSLQLHQLLGQRLEDLLDPVTRLGRGLHEIDGQLLGLFLALFGADHSIG